MGTLKSLSMSSFFCAALFLSPRTSLSLNASFKGSTNTVFSCHDHGYRLTFFLISLVKSESLSLRLPDVWGEKCLVNMSIISLYVLLPGLSGCRMFRIRVNVFGLSTLRKVAVLYAPLLWQNRGIALYTSFTALYFYQRPIQQ